MMWLPSGTEPGEGHLAHPGSARIISEIIAGSPTSTLTTPAGMPPASAAFASHRAAVGVSSAGLTMMVQPAAVAAAILRAAAGPGSSTERRLPLLLPPLALHQQAPARRPGRDHPSVDAAGLVGAPVELVGRGRDLASAWPAACPALRSPTRRCRRDGRGCRRPHPADAGSGPRVGVAPGLESAGGGVEGLGDLGGRDRGDFGRRRSVGRIDHRETWAAAAPDTAEIDESASPTHSALPDSQNERERELQGVSHTRGG